VRDSVQAIILIGGEGTRLRPLTLDLPKPLLPVCNRPFLSYQFELLRRHGVRDIVLCTAYGEKVFKKTFGDGRGHGVRLRYVHEASPLGTGGAVKNAEALVRGTSLVFNGDVLNAMDLAAFLRFHRTRKADATIALAPVEDPTRYGLVETGSDGRVKRFIEKPSPQEVTTDKINAGTYVFEPSVFRRIPAGVVYSVERSLFPGMLGNGTRLYGFVRRGYWLDIGTAEAYLKAHDDILQGRTPFSPAGRRTGTLWLEKGAKIDRRARVEGAACVGQGARVEADACLRGSSAVGAGCVVEQGAVLDGSVLLPGTRVGARAKVIRSIVGPDSKIGRDAVLEGAALGAKANVPAYSKA
jgi:NDP-sugar pyrophosphorylase family protein